MGPAGAIDPETGLRSPIDAGANELNRVGHGQLPSPISQTMSQAVFNGRAGDPGRVRACFNNDTQHQDGARGNLGMEGTFTIPSTHSVHVDRHHARTLCTLNTPGHGPDDTASSQLDDNDRQKANRLTMTGQEPLPDMMDLGRSSWSTPPTVGSPDVSTGGVLATDTTNAHEQSPVTGAQALVLNGQHAESIDKSTRTQDYQPPMTTEQTSARASPCLGSTAGFGASQSMNTTPGSVFPISSMLNVQETPHGEQLPMSHYASEIQAKVATWNAVFPGYDDSYIDADTSSKSPSVAPVSARQSAFAQLGPWFETLGNDCDLLFETEG